MNRTIAANLNLLINLIIKSWLFTRKRVFNSLFFLLQKSILSFLTSSDHCSRKARQIIQTQVTKSNEHCSKETMESPSLNVSVCIRDFFRLIITGGDHTGGALGFSYWGAQEG